MKYLFLTLILLVGFGVQEVSASNAIPPTILPSHLVEPNLDIDNKESLISSLAPNCSIRTAICWCGDSVTFQHCTGEGALHPPLMTFVHQLCAQGCGLHPPGTGWQVP